MSSSCDSGNEYDGRMGVRISSIFVILVGSFLGAWFPVYAARHRGVGVPGWAFFIAKYFGSGVIVATAFIHLLAPASDALTSECLTGPITQYDWAEGIALMSIFLLFFIELMTMRFANFGPAPEDVEGQSTTSANESSGSDTPYSDEMVKISKGANTTDEPSSGGAMLERSASVHMPGEDHLSHLRNHPNDDSDPAHDDHTHAHAHETSHSHSHGHMSPDSYAAQLTGIFILEFGVVFHSIFIGLTLAVTGADFNTLYVVLAFHQTFEGLALGTRLASIPWPKSKKWTPYILAAGYAISTPIAIAIGLGVRTTFGPTSSTTLIVNGVFDAISAGILIYTGLIELMAHEFMFSEHMQRAPVIELLSAFGLMCLGAGLMALLGKWA